MQDNRNIRNFVIVAHVDHGKSTLADRLLELTGTIEKRKMHEQFLDQMELERERGITIKLQPVRMQYGEYILNLIDTPGHVDFTYEVSRSLAAVEGAILLVDAAKGVQAQTLANLHLAQKSRFVSDEVGGNKSRILDSDKSESGQDLVIIPVINKIDLPNARIAEAEEEISNLLAVKPDEIIKISAKTGEGVEKVLEAVVEKIPPPSTHYSLPTTNYPRALIFDSAFDAYKGVVAYVRIFDGNFRAGDKIKLFASKAEAEIIEVGRFKPALSKTDSIGEGEIGYIATGLKNPGDVRVGDTIFTTNYKLQTTNFLPLPGYKEPMPVVFASFFPEKGEDYDLLKDALGKLKLTDASLTYEPESSPALGRGFRLGFLGMLHTEIISERLRREFKLNLIISSPSVEYHILKKNGQEIPIRSASEMPDPSYIDKISEPTVVLELLSPSEYLGSLMKLLSEMRSSYLATDYLTKEIVILKYKVPLAEIVTDFYDKLKSVSSGYASMSYSPPHSLDECGGKQDGYEESDLVRLDILVAGDLVEPFSRMVPRSRANDEGKRIVEKLKKIIPRQWFAVAIQAAIGGKIIARETISALRKDVTGYLYGGDITRKKKLLEKQKRGKARMKEEGKVNIPQEVFLEMLKK